MKKKNLLTLCSGKATTLELKNYKITSDDVLDFSNLYEEVMKLEKKSVMDVIGFLFCIPSVPASAAKTISFDILLYYSLANMANKVFMYF